MTWNLHRYTIHIQLFHFTMRIFLLGFGNRGSLLHTSCAKAQMWVQSVLGLTLTSSFIPNKLIFLICEGEVAITFYLIG